jgi:uncharacterized membrane protein
MSTTYRITRAIAALLSATLVSGCAAEVAAAKRAAAIDRGAPERCFGVARAGRNDCRTAVHICAGWAHRDSDPHAFVYVPTGTCDRIAGGLTDEASIPPMNAP